MLDGLQTDQFIKIFYGIGFGFRCFLFFCVMDLGLAKQRILFHHFPCVGKNRLCIFDGFLLRNRFNSLFRSLFLRILRFLFLRTVFSVRASCGVLSAGTVSAKKISEEISKKIFLIVSHSFQILKLG